MERLTEKHYKAGDGYYMKCSGTCGEGCCDGCPKGDEFVDRLGQIEDILGDTYDLDRLRELVEADKAERCYVLPCKTGDYVYVNLMGKTLPFLIISANQITEDPIFKAMHGNSLCFMFKSYNVGTDVFLTREAAESSLAKEADHE